MGDVAQQFNVPLGERYALALGALTMRDDMSVPEVLRPVVERFIDQQLAADADLLAAVEALTRARASARPPQVTRLATRRKSPSRGPDAPAG